MGGAFSVGDLTRGEAVRAWQACVLHRRGACLPQWGRTLFFVGGPTRGEAFRASGWRHSARGRVSHNGAACTAFFVGAPPSGRSFLGLAGLCSAKARLLGSAQPGENLEGVVAVGGFVEIAGEDQLVGLGLLQEDLQPRADLLRPADQCHAEEVADGVLFVR